MSVREQEIERRTDIWRRALEEAAEKDISYLRMMRDTVRKRLRQEEGKR